MYARVVTIEFHPEVLPAVADMFRQSSAPLMKTWPGFRVALGLMNRTTGKSLSVSVWKTPTERDESGLRVDYVRELAAYGTLVRGLFSREGFDVSVNTLGDANADDPTASPVARVTIASVRPEKWSQAVGLLGELTQPNGRRHSGFQGGLLFENVTAHKAMVIELWDNPSTLSATDMDASSLGHLARRNQLVTAPVTHEVFEVAGYYQ